VTLGDLPRLTDRLAEVAKMLGISRRTLERERAAGRFPRPDLHVGKAPLWKIETLRSWIEGQGR
jgi:predicted DNA-binding transcriptional regulator AlpA